MAFDGDAADPMTLRVDQAAERSSPDATGSGVVAWYAEGFRDGLGDRLLLFDTSGPGLELLRVNGDLARADGFEALLRDRISALQGFRHPAFAQIRTVKWLDDAQPTLAVVSEHLPGERLSRVLRLARARGLRPSPDAVVWMLRKLLPPLAALQERQGIAHGLLTADRIVVSPDGGLAIADHVFAGAVERLRFAPYELWDRFGIAVEPGAGLSRQGDVEQLARLAIAMLVERVDVSSPGPVPPVELLAQVRERLDASEDGRLGEWLARALGVDEPGFYSARAAESALDGMLASRTGEWAKWLLPVPPEQRALARAPQPGGSAGNDDDEEMLPTVVMSRAELDALNVAAAVAAARATGDLPTVLLPFIAPKARRHRLWRYAAIGLAAVASVEAVVLVTGRLSDAERAIPHVSSPVLRTPTALEAVVPPASVLAADASEPVHAGAGARGWLVVRSDLPLRIYADGRLLGTGRGGTFRLAEGDHQVLLENMDAGVHVKQSVRVVAGQTVSIARGGR
jgi:hypothetical protein